MHHQQTAFENILGKEEIAISSFPIMFSTQKIVSPLVNIYDITSLFAAKLEEPKIGISFKGLSPLLSQHDLCLFIYI